MLVLSPISLASPPTGEGVRISALTRQMTAAWDVTVVSPTNPADWASTDLASSASQRYLPIQQHGVAATAIRSIALPFDNARFSYRWNHGGSDLGTFDVAYVHQPRGWDVWRRLAGHARARMSVLDLQNDDFDLWMQRAKQEKSLPMRLASRVYARRAAAKVHKVSQACSLLCCVSEADRASLLQREGDGLARKLVVVPNGVDNRHFRPPSTNRREPATMIFVGSLDTRMNQIAATTLLEIWPELLRRLPQAKLSLVGRSPSAALLAAASNSVRVTASPTDVRPYLWRASAFLAPFRAAGGTKIKLLEAMAAGVPIIATPESMQGIPAEPGRHYLGVANPNEIPAAAERLHSDPALAKTLSEQGANLAESFDWSLIGARTIGLMSEHLSRAA